MIGGFSAAIFAHSVTTAGDQIRGFGARQKGHFESRFKRDGLKSIGVMGPAEAYSVHVA
jgi:hypothetical protein